MKFAILLPLAFAASSAFASGTSRVVESETKTVLLENNEQLQLECHPGRGGKVFPTESSLILRGLGGLFASTKLDYLVHSDTGVLGDNCASLTQDFLARLPAQLKVTRTVTETCWIDDTHRDTRAHKIQWQNLSGSAAGVNFGSGDEILSDIFEENGTCP